MESSFQPALKKVCLRRVFRSKFERWCVKNEVPFPTCLSARETNHLEICEACQTLWLSFVYRRHFLEQQTEQQYTAEWERLSEPQRLQLMPELAHKDQELIKSLVKRKHVTGFQLFLKEQGGQAEFKEGQDPQVHFQHLSSQASHTWRELSAEQQQSYVKEAKQKNAEPKVFIQNLPRFMKEKVKEYKQESALLHQDKAGKSPGRKPNPFMTYLTERWQQVKSTGEITYQELLQQVTQEWRVKQKKRKAPEPDPEPEPS